MGRDTCRCDLRRLLRALSVKARNQPESPGLMGSTQLGSITCKGHPDLGQSLSSESYKLSEKRAGSFSVRLLCSTADTDKNFDRKTYRANAVHVQHRQVFLE